ncbi:uncharacterized protein LOC131157388 [Malania oleifera]|uniref:uncharacterized protein LOC131157388 n=1 Tax=Malania oleifera TaxID=397392 RepID=UPI0025AE082A|nr:uncharacterized protein LOC131157388 [Malania oleifera]
MSSILSSQGVVLATAMAVSGTVILLALRRQKIQFPIGQISGEPQRVPRSCISSGGKKKKKKVHFAEDVVDPSGDSEEFRKRHILSTGFSSPSSSSSSSSSSNELRKSRNAKIRGMPANRAALYNGILRDRGVHRLAFAY